MEVHSPADARRLGIGMLFQDFSLIPALSVAENIALFLQRCAEPWSTLGQVERRIQELAGRYQLQVRTGVKVSELRSASCKRSRSSSCCSPGPESSSSMSRPVCWRPHEVTALFRVLDTLRADGYAIVLITHKIKEVLECADRITILRGGRVAGSFLRAEATREEAG